jgi:hypothetical protein
VSEPQLTRAKWDASAKCSVQLKDLHGWQLCQLTERTNRLLLGISKVILQYLFMEINGESKPWIA